jgi:hypothetical protein
MGKSRCIILHGSSFSEPAQEVAIGGEMRCVLKIQKLRSPLQIRREVFWQFSALCKHNAAMASLSSMDAELMNRLNDRLQQARAARQFAKQCRERTAVLVMQAKLLLDRFDEIEYRALLKEASHRARLEKKSRALAAGRNINARPQNAGAAPPQLVRKMAKAPTNAIA